MSDAPPKSPPTSPQPVAPEPDRRRNANRWLLIWLAVVFGSSGLTVAASAVDSSALTMTTALYFMSLLAVTVVSILTAVFNGLRMPRHKAGLGVLIFFLLFPTLTVGGLVVTTFISLAGCSLVGPTVSFH